MNLATTDFSQSPRKLYLNKFWKNYMVMEPLDDKSIRMRFLYQ